MQDTRLTNRTVATCFRAASVLALLSGHPHLAGVPQQTEGVKARQHVDLEGLDRLSFAQQPSHRHLHAEVL
jgi:hypothetical protein